MESRMDKYINESNIPKRSDKNKELYRQIYNAYDDFENLIVPSNVKEIDINGLKKEISSRDEYRKIKDYSEITNNKVKRKEIVQEEQIQEQVVYDIKELLNQAVKDKKQQEEEISKISSDSYLKKLHLDNTLTNLENIKEIYDDIRKETEEESEDLLRTANLSLDILSDLKGDNDDTRIEAPIKDEFLTGNNSKFYSNEYKFSKKDFDDKNIDNNIEETDDFYDDEMSDSSNSKFFIKILLLIFSLSLVVVIIIYLVNYFNRV